MDPSTWNRRAFGSCCLCLLFSVVRWTWLLSFLHPFCAVKSLFELWRWRGIFDYIDFIYLSLVFVWFWDVYTFFLFEKIPTDKTVHFYFLWQERDGRWCRRFLLEEKSPGNRPRRKVTKMAHHLEWCQSKDWNELGSSLRYGLQVGWVCMTILAG